VRKDYEFGGWLVKTDSREGRARGVRIRRAVWEGYRCDAGLLGERVWEVGVVLEVKG
jgi:hypothetical protein